MPPAFRILTTFLFCVFITTTVYNMITGQPTKVIDPNGLETRMEYVDPMLRPTRVAAYNGLGQQVGAATGVRTG